MGRAIHDSDSHGSCLVSAGLQAESPGPESTAGAGSAAAMWQLCQGLFPLARSLTGAGVRQSLDLLEQAIDGQGESDAPELQRFSVPSGTAVFDWTVPREWEVRHARLIGPDGQVVIDHANHNLHLMGYSVPIHATMSLAELAPHLHTLPVHPDWIPYRTSYYADNWGFCLTERQRRSLQDGTYQVDIDTRLFDGQMDWAEVFLPGDSDDEILISTHICHPSLANDNLSGIAVATGMINALAKRQRRLGVRFVFVPATIGAIAWLAHNQRRLGAIRHSLVLSNLGDAGPFHYKSSVSGQSALDRVFAHLSNSEPAFSSLAVMPFSPYGYDERQYNSPGIALNAGSLMRTPFGQYPQYHTSADNLDFISASALQESLELCLLAIEALQTDRIYRNLSPMGEPQLGRRGLYRAIGGDNQGQQRQLAMLWLLNQADGTRSLLDVAQRAGLSCQLLASVADELLQAGLLEAI